MLHPRAQGAQSIKICTQTLAAEGVRVNALAPGLISTPMNASAHENPEFLPSRLGRTPVGRVGEPKDLAG